MKTRLTTMPSGGIMRAKVKRWAMLAAGWFFVILGIAGLFLPFLQGILFILIGLLILSSEYVWAHRLLERVKQRFPTLAERADTASQSVHNWLRRSEGMPPMNVLILGAGVIGSIYASRLHESGQQVTILARGKRRADLQQHGLILQNASTGEWTFSRPPVVERLGPTDEYDLIIVAVRATQILSVLPILAADRRTPNLLFMVNTASCYDRWAQVVGKERVLLGFPSVGGTVEGPAIRFGTTGKLLPPTTVGELDGHSTSRLRALAATLRRAGFPVQICSDMAAWQKTHVACVLPLATGLYAAFGDPYCLARTPQILELVVRAIREGFRVLRALSVPITPARLRLLQFVPVPLLVYALRLWVDSRHFETVVVLHANASRDEMGQLAQEFESLVARARVPTPAIDALYSFIAVEHGPLAKAASVQHI